MSRLFVAGFLCSFPLALPAQIPDFAPDELESFRVEDIIRRGPDWGLPEEEDPHLKMVWEEPANSSCDGDKKVELSLSPAPQDFEPRMSPRFERDKLLDLIRRQFGEGDTEMEGVSFMGNVLWVRAPRAKLRIIGRFIEGLRELMTATVHMDFDLVRCDPETALRLLLSPEGRPAILTDAERKELLDRILQGSGGNILLSESLSSKPWEICKVAVTRRGMEAEGAGLQARSYLDFRAVPVPGGIQLEMRGLLPISPLRAEAGDADSGKPRSTGSLVQIQGAFLVPETRTVLAAVSGLHYVDENRSPLLLLVRAGPAPKLQVDLGGMHVFCVADVLSRIREFEGPELILKPPGEQGSQPIEFTNGFAPEDDELDPEMLMQLLKESAGGVEAWEAPNAIEYHSGMLLVSAPPALIRGAEKALGLFRSAGAFHAQVSFTWLALDRASAAALRGGEAGNLALSQEALQKLLEWVKEGRLARIVDATGGSGFEPLWLARGDGWRDWPGEPGAAGGPFLYGSGEDEKEETGARCRYSLYGDPSRDELHLDFKAEVGALFPWPGQYSDIVTARMGNHLLVSNGASYLLGGGPLLSDGKTGVYLLLNASWCAAEAPAPGVGAEAGGLGCEEVPEGMPEPLRRLLMEPARIRKVLSEKVVSWSQSEPAPLLTVLAWLSSETGLRIAADPQIDAQSMQVALGSQIGPLPAGKFLDWVSWKTGLGWAVRRDRVIVTTPDQARAWAGAGWSVPSFDEYTLPEDKETLRALSQEVDLDLSGIKKLSQLPEAISRATKTRYVTSREFDGSDEDLDLDALLPRGPKVIPLLLLSEIRGRVQWFLHEGIVVYGLSTE